MKPKMPAFELNIREVNALVGFTWRCADGTFHLVRDLPTDHLFCILQMVWNNTMPEDAWTHPDFKRYQFGGFYSAQYLMEAVVNVVRELEARDDLRAEYRERYEKIKAYFKRNKLQLKGESDHAKESKGIEARRGSHC